MSNNRRDGQCFEGSRLDFLPLQLETIDGSTLTVPDESKYVHLMFRRFAGCPICNIGIRNYVKQLSLLRSHLIQPVVVFHSSVEETLRFQKELPIPVIADRQRKLYSLFGVGTSIRSVANPTTWLPALREILKSGLQLPKERQNPFVLPADFLVAPDGRLVAYKYGKHAADVWSVQDLLEQLKK